MFLVLALAFIAIAVLNVPGRPFDYKLMVAAVPRPHPDVRNSTLYGLAFDKIATRHPERLLNLLLALKCGLFFDHANTTIDLYEWVPSSNPQRLVDIVSVYRAWGKCYVDGEHASPPPKCNPAIEKKLFPWLIRKMPIYTRWDGSKKTLRPPTRGQCFFQNLRSQYTGRGITLTGAASHLEDFVGIIRLLRLVGSTLPLEIVLTEEFAPETIQTIIHEARNPDQPGTPQDVWFVDVRPAFNAAYEDRFLWWGHKWFAELFSSFDDTMLIDADAVFVQNPEKLFASPKYAGGAYFFRDRSTNVVRDQVYVDNYKALTPLAWDWAMFGTEPLRPEILELNFFKWLQNEQQEAGVVLLKKTTKLSLILLGAAMYVYQGLLQISHGDKEFFWLAMMANGDYLFQFSDKFAGTIGVPSPPDECEYGAKAIEVCSNHITHVVDDRLFWFNGGIRRKGTSRKDDWGVPDDWEHRERFKHVAEKDWALFGQLTFPVSHIVIPPDDITRGGKDKMFAYNRNGDPLAGFRYLVRPVQWCGYNYLGGPDNRLDGEVLEMPQEDIDAFNRIAAEYLRPYEAKDYGYEVDVTSRE